MSQPLPADPDGALVSLAVTRGILDRATAEAVLAARARTPGFGSVVDALVRAGRLTPDVVARLRIELAAGRDATLVERAPAPVRADVATPRPPVGPPLPSAGSFRSPAGQQRHDSVLSSGVNSAFNSALSVGPRNPGPPPPAAIPPASVALSPGSLPPLVIPVNSPEPYSSGPTMASRSVTEASGRGRPPAAERTHRDSEAASRGFRPKVGSRFGRYELLAELGRGGMGIVFRARQSDLQREVALKMLLAGGAADEVDIERFFSEARNAAQLKHPYIVAIHDVGCLEDVHYFTMDYVEGKDLAATGKLPVRQATEVAVKLCEGLAHAHEHGVVHRDLKPSNVLIDKKGNPRITDFGIAKDLKRSTTTRAGDILGTPSYMPPEQATGNAIDADGRADVYSLGAVLYEMLTGHAPFEGKNGYEVMNAVVKDPPKSPRVHEPSVPRDLETIVLKCLEKDRERRYANATALRADLVRWLEGDSIEAVPPARPVIPPLSRKQLALAVAALVLVVAGAGLGLWVRALLIRKAAAEAAALAELQRLEDERKKLAEARKEAEALKVAVGQATVLIDKALEAAKRGESDVAIARGVEAVEVAPTFVRAREVLAKLYLDLRSDAARAREETEAALKVDAQAVEARRLHGRALVQEGRTDEALADAKLLDALPGDGPGESARLRASVFLAREDWQAAAKVLSEACQLLPRSSDARLELARAYLRLGRAVDAEHWSGAAFDLDPENVAALLVRAEARTRQNKTTQALEDAKRARLLAPNDQEARALVERLEAIGASDEHSDAEAHKDAQAASLAARRGDRAAAEAWLARSVPDKECAYVANVRCSVLETLGRLDEADAAFGSAIARTPAAHLYGNRGLLRVRLKRYEEAIADFDAALAPGVTQGMLPAVTGRVAAYVALGRPDAAERSLDAAVKSTDGPLRASVLQQRASFFASQQAFDKAESDLDEAAKLKPTCGHVLDDRGDVRERRGDRKGAVADWTAALGKDLTPEETARVREKIRKAGGT